MAEITRRELLAGTTAILAAAALPIDAFTHEGGSGNSGFQNHVLKGVPTMSNSNILGRLVVHGEQSDN